MNYYERFLGDYGKKTGTLTLAEHGAYTLLLDEYYATEAPLPGPLDEIYRICRAMTKAEREAVAKVAAKHFPIGPDGLRHNERADEEIPKAQARIEAARANGKRSHGRPKKNPPGSKTETPEKPTGLPDGIPTGIPPGQLTTRHTPIPMDTSVGFPTSEALPKDLTPATWAAWKSHLAVKGKGMSPPTERMQLVRLAEHESPEKVVADAIAAGDKSLPPVGGWPSRQEHGPPREPTMTQRKTNTIDEVIAHAGNGQRVIEGSAERVGGATVHALPGGLRESG